MADNTIQFTIKLRGGKESAEDVQRVEKAVQKVGGTMSKVATESERNGKRVSAFGGGLKHMAIGLGAVAAGYAAYSGAKKAIEFTTELAKNTNSLSKATGMSIGKTSGLIAVAGALGVESNKLGMVFSKLGKATIKQAEDTGTTKTAFDRLHISHDEAKHYLNDTAGMLDLVTHKLATEHIPAGEKAALMTELFGKGWKSLAPLLLEGETGLSKLTKMAKEFGLELGGKGAESLKKFHDQQVESKLAMMGLQVSFTKLVAGPLGGLLSGFAKLTVYARKGEWGKFNAQVGQMAKSFEVLAEKVLPRVAESFARIAPAVAKAFIRGFFNAPIGAQAVLAVGLVTKMGLTGGFFNGIGKAFGARMAGGIAAGAVADTAVVAGAGTTLGSTFSAAFAAALPVAVAAALGYGAYVAAKTAFGGSGSASEPFGNPYGRAPEHKSAPRRRLEKHEKAVHGTTSGERVMIGGKSYPVGPLGEPIGYHPHHGRHPHAAMGGMIRSAGSVEVGEHGPEVVHLPTNALIDPLKPGSLADNRPIILKVDGKVLARLNRREILQSQAAGA